MTTVNKNSPTPNKSADKKKGTKEKLISAYMEWVLLKEKAPLSVFKFCKENNFKETEFYEYFGSFEGLKIEIWNSFYKQTINLANKDESFSTYSNQEKMLAFFYTFFELLTLNRSYILFSLKEHRNMMNNLNQLRVLRKNIKQFSADLIRESNDDKKLKILKQSVVVFSEGTWIQTLFLLKYWLDDNSAGFENTDIAIEKSVRAIFDVFDTQPLESVLDFGNFYGKKKWLNEDNR